MCKWPSQPLHCGLAWAQQVFLWPQVAHGYQAVLRTAEEGLCDMSPVCWGTVAKSRGYSRPTNWKKKVALCLSLQRRSESHCISAHVPKRGESELVSCELQTGVGAAGVQLPAAKHKGGARDLRQGLVGRVEMHECIGVLPSGDGDGSPSERLEVCHPGTRSTGHGWCWEHSPVWDSLRRPAPRRKRGKRLKGALGCWESPIASAKAILGCRPSARKSCCFQEFAGSGG